ncbi:MAG TPA: PilZ domain-containing protein, partial [Kofleriaceae bacterium]|nr:PilZ domain-containing protein [Kofleriaceae bacterium]
AALMGGALPRLHEGVDIALAFAEHRALVRGQVHKVSTEEEAAQTGAASFHIAFELDEPARRQLTALLIAARAAKVTIKPPPTRRNRRYPVEWPVCLGTMRGALRGEVLDISRGGMFVRPAGTLALDTQVTFSAMLDDDADPVSGRSRVVRYINEADARTCGLAQGYGLKIVQMASLERERWTSFVARIERRAEKRVLIGASAGRLLELQSSLAAVGYVATGAAEPDALAALAGHARAVDACLLDASWLPQRVSASWAEGLFPARRVPCVTLHGDVRRARAALDQALSIV